jgi:hypothetical protein
MFDIHCPRCATRVLLDESRIEAIVNDPDGIVLRYRCWCGTPGQRREGRRRRSQLVDPR